MRPLLATITLPEYLNEARTLFKDSLTLPGAKPRRLCNSTAAR